ncbi:MAG: fused response regulator/phosphatase [Planctomycetes bacterium]|nr:fused response regulator/phosphatase [Planctomycetota bacterium]
MKSILVIDDQSITHKLLKSFIKKVPAEYIGAMNGAGGIELATKHLPDLIILDFQMPKMTGIEVLKKLLRIDETKYIPIWMLTAQGDDELMTLAFDEGITDYIEKPIGVGPFVAKVKRHFKKVEDLLVIQRQEQIDIETELSEDIEQATKTISSMLPPPPEITGYDLKVQYKPLSQVGGDYYDFVKLGDGKMLIEIGDVAGHGIQGAIVHPMVRKLVEIFVRQTSLKTAIMNVNDEIIKELPRGVFVALLICVLDYKNHKMNVLRLGVPFPVKLKKDGTADKIALRGSPPIGVAKSTALANMLFETEIALEPGESVFFFTDGIIEAENKQNEQWAIEEMIDLLNNHNEATCEDITQAAIDFSSGNISDDLTIISVTRNE